MFIETLDTCNADVSHNVFHFDRTFIEEVCTSKNNKITIIWRNLCVVWRDIICLFLRNKISEVKKQSELFELCFANRVSFQTDEQKSTIIMRYTFFTSDVWLEFYRTRHLADSYRKAVTFQIFKVISTFYGYKATSFQCSLPVASTCSKS